MKKLIFFTAMLFSTAVLLSQTTVNYIPKFTSTTGGLGNSLLFQNSNKIGLGLTTPQSLLHIHSSVTEDCPPVVIMPLSLGLPTITCSSSRLQLTNLNSGSTVTDGLLIKSINNNAEIYLQESGVLRLYVNDFFSLNLNSSNFSIGANKFFVNSSGKVGIGTYSPKEKIQIGDEFVFHDGGTKYWGRNCYYDTATDLNKKIVSGYSSMLSFPSNGSIRLFTYANGSAGATLVQTGNITLNNDGTVGIGTDNTYGYKLAIAGNVIAE
jgi:hypothetical protein